MNIILIKLNLQWTEDKNIYTVLNKVNIEAMSVFYALYNRYTMFFMSNFPKFYVKGNLYLVYSELYENFKSPLLYTSISPKFVYDYTRIYDMKKYILNKNA